MKNLLFILLTILFAASCKNKVETGNVTTPYEQAKYTSSKIVQTSTACVCLTTVQVNNCINNAPNATIQQFLGSAPSKTFVITWNNCVASNNSSSNGCGSPLSGVTSTLILCYSNLTCTKLNAHFIGKPQCLPCMPDDYCIELTPTKSTIGGSTDYVLFGNYNNEILNNVTIDVIVSSDPDITIKCSTNISNPGNSVSYTCFGHW